MDRRNDPSPSPPPRGPWSPSPQARGPWSRWNRPAPAPAATLATPFSWMGGSLLLAGTTFLVSVVALVRALVALVD